MAVYDGLTGVYQAKKAGKIVCASTPMNSFTRFTAAHNKTSHLAAPTHCLRLNLVDLPDYFRLFTLSDFLPAFVSD